MLNFPNKTRLFLRRADRPKIASPAMISRNGREFPRYDLAAYFTKLVFEKAKILLRTLRAE
ncbi:hypothetical protein D3C83_168700 [compost metagenome]